MGFRILGFRIWGLGLRGLRVSGSGAFELGGGLYKGFVASERVFGCVWGYLRLRTEESHVNS